MFVRSRGKRKSDNYFGKNKKRDKERKRCYVSREERHLEIKMMKRKMASITKICKKQEGKRFFASIRRGVLCLKEVEAKGEINKKGKISKVMKTEKYIMSVESRDRERVRKKCMIIKCKNQNNEK